MRLPNFRRLIKSDYSKEYELLIEKLSFSINNGVEVLYQAFNKAISLKDNIACTLKDIDVEVKEDGSVKTLTSFNLDTQGKIIGILVLNVVNTRTPSILPNSGFFVSFTQESNKILINSIKGLPPNQPFKLTLVAFDL